MSGIKYFILGIILLQLTACSEDAYNVECVPFKKALSEKWGLLAPDGTTAMKERYNTCPTAVVNGRYGVQDANGYWQLYEFPSGKKVSNRTFRAIGYFMDDVTMAVAKDKIEIIDKNGRTIQTLNDNITEAHNFQEGEAVVQFKNGSYGFIDKTGNLCPYVYDYASDFSDGVAIVGNYDNAHAMHYLTIDKDWNTVAEIDVSGIRILEHYHNGKLPYINTTTGAYGLIDKNGKRLTSDEETKKLIETMENRRTLWKDNVHIKQTGDSYMLVDDDDNAITDERYAAIAYDGYMSGALIQTFSAQLPRPANSFTSRNDSTVGKDTITGGNGLKSAEQLRAEGAISRLNDALNSMAESTQAAAVDPTDPAFRKVISGYVECLRAAYEDKNMKFLQQVFSDDALIITGRIVKSGNSQDGYLPKKKVEYNIRSKREYLQKLSKVFQLNKSIQLSFSQIKIVRHPTKDGFYGVTLKQGYRSDHYADEGYMFMLWDFRNPNKPQIHVRTWQPSMTSGNTLMKKDIYSIGDFTLE
jgi:hypothetical protein